jgi:NAD-dependent DNA ligase
VQKISDAREAYYNSANTILKDEEFDNLIDKLEELDPNNPALKEVGYSVDDSKKVKLPYFLPSMDKHKKETLSKWTSKYSAPYVVSEKLDGVSIVHSIEWILQVIHQRKWRIRNRYFTSYS